MMTSVQYRILKAISPGEPKGMDGSVYAGQSKLSILLGELLGDIRDKVVIDFGCGDGHESIELAQSGARRVVGVDIRENALARARTLAAQAGVADRCEFTTKPADAADVIVSLDSFEHFSDPAAILRIMRGQLKPEGCVIASFGPTWFHPLGGHLFSVCPWAHLIFTEKALIRWRNDIRNDGASRFAEVEGGLNQMTIKRFEGLVRESPFHLDFLEAVPIRKLKSIHSSITREFTTAIVRCRLTPKA